MEIIRPGEIRSREGFIKFMDRKVGKGRWFRGISVGKKLYSMELGLQIYEDAYFTFFRQSLERIKFLAKGYSDVFVIDNQDLQASTDYKMQTQPKEHFQDIAIRRCFRRLGIWFQGKGIFKIPDSEYDDNKISFHMPQLHRHADSIGSIRSWLHANLVVIATPTIEDQVKLAEMLIK